MQVQSVSLMDAVGQGVFCLVVALLLVAAGWCIGVILLVKGQRRTAVRFPLLWSALPAGCAIAAFLLGKAQLDGLVTEMAAEGNPLPPDIVAQLSGLPMLFAMVGLGAASSLLVLALLGMFIKRDPEPVAREDD